MTEGVASPPPPSFDDLIRVIRNEHAILPWRFRAIADALESLRPPPGAAGQAEKVGGGAPEWERGGRTYRLVAQRKLLGGGWEGWGPVIDSELAACLAAMGEERRESLLRPFIGELGRLLLREQEKRHAVTTERDVAEERIRYFRREITRLTEFNGDEENPDPSDADYIHAVDLEITCEYERAEAAEGLLAELFAEIERLRVAWRSEPRPEGSAQFVECLDRLQLIADRRGGRLSPPASQATSRPAADHSAKAAGEGRIYPCAHPGCTVMRTKDEGGTIFTVCDEHWDEAYGKKGPHVEREDSSEKAEEETAPAGDRAPVPASDEHPGDGARDRGSPGTDTAPAAAVVEPQSLTPDEEELIRGTLLAERMRVGHQNFDVGDVMPIVVEEIRKAHSRGSESAIAKRAGRMKEAMEKLAPVLHWLEYLARSSPRIAVTAFSLSDAANRLRSLEALLGDET